MRDPQRPVIRAPDVDDHILHELRPDQLHRHVLPGFTGANWWGMAVPAGTPEPIIRKITEAVTEALRDPAVVARFDAMGLLIPKETPAQFAAGLKSEAALWSETVRRGKITIE